MYCRTHQRKKRSQTTTVACCRRHRCGFSCSFALPCRFSSSTFPWCECSICTSCHQGTLRRKLPRCRFGLASCSFRLSSPCLSRTCTIFGMLVLVLVQRLVQQLARSLVLVQRLAQQLARPLVQRLVQQLAKYFEVVPGIRLTFQRLTLRLL